MTDPTKQAATTKTARETIKAHVRACERWAGGPEGLQREATAPTSGYISEMMRTALPLRALLDAPEGAVGRFIEQAADYFRAVTGRTPEDAALTDSTRRLPPETQDFIFALAALRASPDSLSAAPKPCELTCEEHKRQIRAERDALRVKYNEIVKRVVGGDISEERDRLKAELAAARGEVERLNGGSDAAWSRLRSNLGLQATVDPQRVVDYALVAMANAEQSAIPPSATEAPVSERAAHDLVNHPAHYCAHPSGVECIQITEHLPFCVGNAIKYLWRHDAKNGVEDLKKARWYVSREIGRREAANVLAAAERAAKGEGGA